VLSRLGGDEFAVLLTNQEPDEVTKALKRFSMNLDEINKFASKKYVIEYSVGVLNVDDFEKPVDTLLAEADRLMYQDKQQLS
jgi:diguanylate cyclase (GGDEF)-like protein